MVLTCAFRVERVTGIEPALSAWEAVPSGPVTWPDRRGGVSASDRVRPLVTGVNGPLMARAANWPGGEQGRTVAGRAAAVGERPASHRDELPAI